MDDKFFIEQNCGKEFQNILDVGCGTGKFISLFNSNNKTGFDIDKSVITNNKLQYDEINFISDLNDLNENEKFDLIIFRGTFQYMRDLLAIKELITKKLINGGHLVILSIPNKNSPLANIQREHWSLYNPIEMFNIFSISSLKMLFDDFETVDVEYPYLDTPYADEKQDMKKFLDLVKINKQEKFAFWGSMMQIIFRK